MCCISFQDMADYVRTVVQGIPPVLPTATQVGATPPPGQTFTNVQSYLDYLTNVVNSIPAAPDVWAEVLGGTSAQFESLVGTFPLDSIMPAQIDWAMAPSDSDFCAAVNGCVPDIDIWAEVLGGTAADYNNLSNLFAAGAFQVNQINWSTADAGFCQAVIDCLPPAPDAVDVWAEIALGSPSQLDALVNSFGGQSIETSQINWGGLSASEAGDIFSQFNLSTCSGPLMPGTAIASCADLNSAATLFLGGLTNHLNDTADAHDATAISAIPGGAGTPTAGLNNVQAQLDALNAAFGAGIDVSQLCADAGFQACVNAMITARFSFDGTQACFDFNNNGSTSA